MTHHTPMKLRTVRCIATGELTTQSTTKTKKLLSTGCYEEITEGGAPLKITHQRTPQRDWRAIGTASAVVLGALILLAWLRFIQVI